MNNSVFFRPIGKLTGYINTLQDSELFDRNIAINYSSIYESYNPKSAFNHSTNAISVLKNGAWLSFTLKDKYFYITHYEIQQRDYTLNDVLKNWTFEGSNDMTSWHLLDRKIINSDDPFYALEASKVFVSKRGVFNSFRIKQSVGLLVINKIEIYGFLCDTKEYCQLNYMFRRSCMMRKQSIFTSFAFIINICSAG